ncbi:MAG TPA: sugar phosphate isomerase/epimerase family protein [Chloroflexota bacterium]|nr:sugar phosphate isomerase/epimerase family protein [Chloroflexota bacterium]
MDRSRLAVSTWSLHEQLGPRRLTRRDADGVKRPHEIPHPQTMSLLDFLAQVRPRLDLDRVEICAFHVPGREPAYVDRLKGTLREHRLAVLSMPIDAGNISVADPAWREDDLREVEGWIDFAADLGASYVRANASSYVAQEPLAPLDVTIASYRRLCDRARARGMTMTIENHGGLTADPETIVRIVEGVGPDRLKVCLDTANFAPVMGHQLSTVPPTGVDPEPLYAGLAGIAPYTGLVHAKTVWFDQAGNHLVYDAHRALRIVRDAGFDGPISIEYGGGVDEWNGALRTRRIVEEVFA